MPETQAGKAGNHNNLNNNHNTDKIKLQIIVGFALIIPIMLTIIIIAFNVRMSEAMKGQTADMIENLNVQIKNNISSYMDTLKGNAGMIVADEMVQEYDPTEVDSDDMTGILNARILSYALYSDYTDFGVVYSNGTTLGKISDEVKSAGGDKLYTVLDKSMNKAGEWTTDIVPGRSRIIYLCRLNDSAIAILGVPSAEMTDDLKDILFINGMNVYLVDKSLVVISTTDDSITLGSYLKTTISRLVDRVDATTQAGDNYVVASQKFDNGWFVVTAVPSDDILTSLKSTIKYVIIIAVVAALLAIAYVIYMTHRIVNSVNQTVDKLDVKAQTDLLTGLINKRSFEEIVEMTLDNPEEGTAYAMIFMDIDNFKGVNDRCGHDVGDLVLKSFSHTIDTVFRETDVKGRLGGDEFCVLMKMTEEERELLVGHVNEVCRRFIEALHRKANSARQSLPAVTSSMGAALWDGSPEGFEQLYHKADTALYASKKRGKDTWTVYGQNGIEDEEVQAISTESDQSSETGN